MRIFVLLAITLAAVLVCEGRHHKEDRRKFHKASTREIGVPYSHHGSTKHDKHHRSRLRGQHLDLDHFKSLDVKSLKDDEWMKFPKKSEECKTIKCPPKHFCLTDPTSQKERCVSYQNFKKGRRLFRSYHRQKALLERKGGKMSDAMEHKLQKAEKMKDVYDLIKDYKKTLSHEQGSHKIIDIKNIAEAVDQKNVKEADPATLQECRPNEVYQLRKRLVGWFVLLHTESRQHHHKAAQHKPSGKRPIHDPFAVDNSRFEKHYKLDKHHGKLDKHHSKLDKHHDKLKRTKRSTHTEIDIEIHGHCKCSKSVMWEFRKMDAITRDGHLQHDELASIESIKREPCLKPLIKSCDHNSDGKLSRGEWCCCMKDTVPPCAEKKRLTKGSEWQPSCDAEGYFKREQCHKSGHCWCVDIDGNPIADTKTLGSAHCGKYDPNGKLIKM